MHSYISTFLSLFYFDKSRVILSIFLSIIQSICLFPTGLIVKYLLDHVHDKSDSKILFWGLIGSFLLILCNTMIVLYKKHISLTLIKSFRCDLREKLRHKLIFLNANFYVSENLDKIHSQIVHDTERLDNIHGKQLNCFGLLSRQNEFIFKTTTKNINTDFVIDFLERVSFSIIKQTVIILDNARIHTAHKIKSDRRSGTY